MYDCNILVTIPGEDGYSTHFSLSETNGFICDSSRILMLLNALRKKTRSGTPTLIARKIANGICDIPRILSHDKETCSNNREFVDEFMHSQQVQNLTTKVSILEHMIDSGKKNVIISLLNKNNQSLIGLHLLCTKEDNIVCTKSTPVLEWVPWNDVYRSTIPTPPSPPQFRKVSRTFRVVPRPWDNLRAPILEDSIESCDESVAESLTDLKAASEFVPTKKTEDTENDEGSNEDETFSFTEKEKHLILLRAIDIMEKEEEKMIQETFFEVLQMKLKGSSEEDINATMKALAKRIELFRSECLTGLLSVI